MDDKERMDMILKANEAGDILGHRFTEFEILTRAFTRAAFVKEERERLKKAGMTTDIEDQDPLATYT